MRKLRDVVEEFMLGRGEPTTGSNFMRYYQLAIDGARMVSQQTANPGWYKKIKTIELNEAGVFPMPSDMVDYHYIGVCVNGTMHTLIHSPDMCMPMLDDCGDQMPISREMGGIGFTGFDVYNKPVEYQFTERGHFAINWEDRYFVIERDGLNFDSVKLVYRTAMEQVNGDFYIFEHDEWAIKDAINYGLLKHDPRIPVSQKDFARREFVNAKRLARRANNPIRVNEVLDAIRR